jgi:hypothetical protein
MPASAAKSKSATRYDVHPGVAMVQKWIVELKPTTGRSLEEWIAVVKKDGPKDSQARRAWLKSKHKLGTNSAWWIADRAEGKGTEEDSPEKYLATAVQYVEEQYAGKKIRASAHVQRTSFAGQIARPRRQSLPCKTMVPRYREHVFAQIKPSINSRIDLGLCFTTYKGKLPKRLIDTGGLAKKDRITQRIKVSSPSDIDAELKTWLRAAYDLNA